MPPILHVDGLRKRYHRGTLRRQVVFSLEADFTVAAPAIVGVMGPNGSGKTTLFELITGSNAPSAGRVLVGGQDIHGVRTDGRDRLAIHYHQSYQVRRYRAGRPDFLLERPGSDRPLVHLFDEPQFSAQDGYVGFMLAFFRRLRAAGRVVFICLHPTEPFHLDLMRQTCDRFLFVHRGSVTAHADWSALDGDPRFRDYLGQPV